MAKYTGLPNLHVFDESDLRAWLAVERDNDDIGRLVGWYNGAPTFDRYAMLCDAARAFLRGLLCRQIGNNVGAMHTEEYAHGIMRHLRETEPLARFYALHARTEMKTVTHWAPDCNDVHARDSRPIRGAAVNMLDLHNGAEPSPAGGH
jgi:hypothetical protein